MPIRTNFLTSVAVSLLLGGAAFAQDVTAETVVATIGGEDITVGHMIVLRDALPEQYQSLEDDVLFDGLLDQLVQQTVLAQKANVTGAAVELRLDNERRSLLAGSAITDILASAVTDETLQAAYDAQYASVEPAQEFNASHILVTSEEEANALIAELGEGADFAELAKSKSTGPSGPNGGELGWFGEGMMVKPFEDAVVEMEVGQVSAAVQTQFGWHVIKLNDARTKDAPTLEEVRAELVDALQQSVIQETLAKLVSEADITRPDISAIDRSVIRNNDLISK